MLCLLYFLLHYDVSSVIKKHLNEAKNIISKANFKLFNKVVKDYLRINNRYFPTESIIIDFSDTLHTPEYDSKLK